ncbi:MAG TPA: hypothetical protein GX701_00755 [Clostridiales bacterium]|nr:hypothetical protein [Clostridiales bacterium]
MKQKKQFDKKNNFNMELAEELIPDGSLGQTSMRHAKRHLQKQHQENKSNMNNQRKGQKETS